MRIRTSNLTFEEGCHRYLVRRIQCDRLGTARLYRFVCQTQTREFFQVRLYNSQGGSIAVSKKGTAGKHVGQELDAFLTYTYGANVFGAGFGHLFKGGFIMNTTPQVNPRYFYVFQQYSFK